MARGAGKRAVVAHYDAEDGLGNLYKLNAGWSTGFKAVFRGWESVPEHSGGMHYGYDFNGRNDNEALRKPFLEAFENLKIKKGKVLDCGCGVGGASLALAPLHSAVSFIGVSLSPGQVAMARRRAEKAGVHNASFQVADYLRLPFEDGTFDGITGIETFCYIEDAYKPRLFRELRRVLKSGGKIAIFDAFLSGRPAGEMKLRSRHARVFRGWALPPRISTARSACAFASRAGFGVVKNTLMTDRILAWSREVSNRALLSIPLIPLFAACVALRKAGVRLPGFHGLGFDDPGIFGFAYTTRFQYGMFKSGDVEYREIVLQKK